MICAHRSSERSTPRIALLASAALGAALLATDALQAQRSESLYSLIRDDNRTYELTEARKLLRSGKRLAGVELLRSVLRCSPSAVVRVTKGRWTGLREAARRELAGLDPEARRIYERMVDPEVAPRLRGVLARRAPEEITRVAVRYPSSSTAHAARLLAGDLFLEEGRTLRALREFDLLAANSDDPALLLRRSFGRALAGLAPEKAALREAKLELAGEVIEGDALLARLDNLRQEARVTSWNAYGGGLSHERRPLDPVDAREPFWDATIEHLDSERQPLNLFATSDGRKVFVNTGTRLYGLDLFRGREGESWSSVSPIANVPSIGEQQEFLNGISNNFAHSSAVTDGIVIAPLQVPIVPPTAGNNHNFNHIPIMRRLPVRRLHAFDADSGRLLWAHYDERTNKAPPRFARLPLDVSGPPLIVDETAYVLTHNQIGTIALYLCAFDLRSGALQWKTLICSSQTEVNMFGNRSSEFAAPPLAYDGGTIFSATNLGLCFAARADDGSLRWIQEYPIIPIPRSRMRPRPRQTFWANNPPVVSGERVLFTPVDSYDALCLDTSDGAIEWRLKVNVIDDVQREYSQLRWCLGVLDGQAWFAGTALARVDMQSGQMRLVASGRSLGIVDDMLSMIPRPLLTEERIYFQSPSGGLRVLDHDGRFRANMQRRPERVEIGNMMAAAGVLVTTRPRSVHAYLSLEELLARARRDVESAPEDPRAALAFAELLAARPNATDHEMMLVTQRFRDVLKLVASKELGDASPVALRAKTGLFENLRSLAKSRRDLGREAQAREMQSEAMDLARELWLAGTLEENELLRLTIQAVRASGAETRRELLDILERDHARAVYAFGASQKAKVGLFVLIQRFADLENEGPRAAKEQLAILRKVLLDYGDDTLPETEATVGRKFAIENIAQLVERHGAKLYESYETDARRLYEAAGEDRGKLQVVLEQYPTSKTATAAIVRLASLAADRGDLPSALEAFRYGSARMATVPADLLRALSRAARGSGNPVFAAHVEAGAKASRAAISATPRRKTLLTKPCTLQLQHTRNLSTSKYDSRLDVEVIEGFGDSAAADLPLILTTTTRAAAFAPIVGKRKSGSEQPRIDDKKPIWSLRYDASLRPLQATVYGDLLVLPEERAIRGIRLRDGSTAWRLGVGELGAETGRGFVRARALANGLFGLVVGKLRADASTDWRFVGVEPRSGAVCFDVADDSRDGPHLRSGHCFALDRVKSGIRLRILDPLMPRNEVLIFDGESAPAIGMLSRSHVMITPDQVFVRISFRAAVDKPGLFTWKRTPTGLQRGWTYEYKSKHLDTFVIRGDEVLLTEDFKLRAVGSLHRVDRATGTLRKRIECGYEAEILERHAGLELDDIGPGGLSILGTDENARALLCHVASGEGKNSWASVLPESILSLPLYKRMPPPFMTEGELTLVIPRMRETHARDFRVERFTLDSARRVQSELGRKPWEEYTEVSAWNGMLLVRTRRNAWLFGDRIEGTSGADTRRK